MVFSRFPFTAVHNGLVDLTAYGVKNLFVFFTGRLPPAAVVRYLGSPCIRSRACKHVQTLSILFHQEYCFQGPTRVVPCNRIHLSAKIRHQHAAGEEMVKVQIQMQLQMQIQLQIQMLILMLMLMLMLMQMLMLMLMLIHIQVRIQAEIRVQMGISFPMRIQEHDGHLERFEVPSIVFSKHLVRLLQSSASLGLPNKGSNKR